MKPLVKNSFQKYVGWLLLAVSLFFTACANIVPPDGGPKDTEPPVLLSIQPKDSSLNKKVKRIELRFNKYMEVQDIANNLQFSPLIAFSPTVVTYGKTIVIKITDSLLEENTTYKLSLGDALVDNRESTPYPNFVYTFSTGAYFDSLHLRGQVFDAETGNVASGATIVLYPSQTPDSAISHTKPQYVQKADASGNFEFSSLPNKTFKIFALLDENNNYQYDKGTDKIDFFDSLVTPHSQDSTILKFHIFKEEIEEIKHSDTLEKDSMTVVQNVPSKEEHTGKPALGSDAKPKLGAKPPLGKKSDKNLETEGYLVHVDTIDKNKATQDIRQPLLITKAASTQVDTSKIFLSYDDRGIEIEAIHDLILDSNSVQLKTEWKEDKLYVLRLVKGWAKDNTGVELSPGKYYFRTMSKNDYGSLTIQFDSTWIDSTFVLNLQTEGSLIASQKIQSPSISFSLLSPDNYSIKVFKDVNGNGKWDTGNLLERRHAEKVFAYPQTIIVKKAWDNIIDFEIEKKAKPKAGEEKNAEEKEDTK